MSTDTLDLQAVRDWHARDQGWTLVENCTCVLAIVGRHNHWTKGTTLSGAAHPIPPTLDAADACMPKGWTWRRSWSRWVAENSDNVAEGTPDTGHKATDLFNLARLCRIAEGAKP